MLKSIITFTALASVNVTSVAVAGLTLLSFATTVFAGGRYDYPPINSNNSNSYPPNNSNNSNSYPLNNSNSTSTGSVTPNNPSTITTFDCITDEQIPNELRAEPYKPGVVWLRGKRNNYEATLIRFSPETSEGSFAAQYNPMSRCQTLRSRLATAITTPGLYVTYGSLNGIRMIGGTRNNYDIVCAVNNPTQFRCDQYGQADFLILTLNRDQEQPAGTVANNFMSTASGQGSSIIRETNGNISVDLGTWEASAFQNNTPAPSPNAPVNPPYQRNSSPEPVPSPNGGGGL